MDKYKKVYNIEYKGKAFSLNTFYNQDGGWYKRVQIKNQYGDIFSTLLENENIKKFDKYKIELQYNSRHDPSNIIGMIKVFEDVLTGSRNRKTGEFKYPQYVYDDSSNYCYGIKIVPNKSLEKNTFKFLLKIIE